RDASPSDDETGDEGDGHRRGPELDEGAVPPDDSEDEGAVTPDDSEGEGAALRAELDALSEELDEIAGDVGNVETGFEELEAQVDEFEDGIEDRTVHREEIERDLKRYVRKRVRRGHARGWGPYLVLLYGTAMTIGAFYFLQDSAGFAILAMIVIWLSTLGLFALMLIVGVIFNVLSLPGRARDAIGGLRNRF
ncbi:MAG: YihY/virulence factor BrkB family protein, partial [Halanaeroarchaeum sp.]